MCKLGVICETTSFIRLGAGDALVPSNKHTMYVAIDDYAGHGNSFHGEGGRGNKRAQMRHCIRVIRSVVSTRDETVIQDLIDQGAINQVMGGCLHCYCCFTLG